MNDNEMRAVIAGRLREARLYIGISQEETANAVGLTRTAIVQIEKGERRVEAVELTRLAAVYQRPVEHFTDSQAEDGLIAEASGKLRALARMANGLEDEDMKELEQFAAFLRDKSKIKKRG
jgi:transcriptional regulator with XRE-family HTH domain